MVQTMSKYPVYKDSGVEWLGEIPKHWDAVSLGSILELKSDKNHPDYEVLSVYREYGVIKKDSRDDNHNATSLDTSTYKAVEPGDLVVNKMKAWQGSMGVSPHKGIVSPAYITCRVNSEKIHPEYLHQLLRCDLYIGEYNRLSYGVRVGQWDMHYEDFKHITTTIPPKVEQIIIANFLDNKTALIDKAIALKEKQIELLKERRQIVIHRAVTRGIGSLSGVETPDVKLKDSGVEWIGEIPEHWEVKRLKFLCHITTGTKNTENKIENGLYPFFVRSQTPERINSYTFDGEAILTAGDGAGVGKVFHYINGKFDFHQRVYRFSNFNEIKGQLLFHYIESNFFNVALLGTAKSTIDSLRLPLIQDFWVCYPTAKEEQEDIIQHIENNSQKISTAITLKEKEIEKLKEYKSVLINEAVSGKIKVV